MNRQQVADFIHALKTLQPHVAPLLFANLAMSEVARLVVAVANGKTVCEVKVAAENADVGPGISG